MSEYPTAAETSALANDLGQSLLKAGRDYMTIPWSEFFEQVEKSTGKKKFDEGMLRYHLHNSVLNGRVQFLINYGGNVVFICKDANFAPVDL